MLRVRIMLVAVALLIVLGLPTSARGQSNPLNLSVSVTTDPAEAPTEDRLIYYELFRNNETTPVQRQTQYIYRQQPRYTYTFPMNRALITPNSTFRLQATVATFPPNLSVKFRGSANALVGGSTNVSITATRATGTLPPFSSGDWRLLAGALLAAVAATLFLWRRQRLRRQPA